MSQRRELRELTSCDFGFVRTSELNGLRPLRNPSLSSWQHIDDSAQPIIRARQHRPHNIIASLFDMRAGVNFASIFSRFYFYSAGALFLGEGMALTDDSWIAENSPIEAEKLHAMGVIAYRWNACELGIRILLASLKGPPFAEVWEETSKSRPSEILKMTETAISRSRHRDHVKKAARYVLKLYKINGRNRNQFSHFLASASKTGIELYNNKTPDFSQVFERPPIPTNLKDFRRVAEEITACMRYQTDISNYLIESFYNPLRILGELPPLPPQPPLPELHWTPNPLARENKKLRPQS